MAVLLHQLIQLKRGTAYDLSNIDPMLAEGEVIVELDSGKFKIGDGVKRWSELAYSGASIDSIVGLQQALAGKQNVGSYVLTNDPRLTDDRPPLSHTHTISNIVNLQANLDEKQPVGNYVVDADPRLIDARNPKPHAHLISDVTGLTEELAAKPTLVGGVVPLAQLPVDQFPNSASDVITVTAFSNLPAAGETDKLYVTRANGKLYYWSGAAYAELTATLDAVSTDALAEGAANLYFTAARASAAAPVQSVAGKTGNILLTKADVGLLAVDNTSDANKPISSAAQNALNDKAALSHLHSLSAITDSGTAAARNVPASGDAASSEVVLGNDTRLADSREPTPHKSTHSAGGNDALTAADVGAAAIDHTHSAAQITGLSAVAVSGSYADLSNKPDITAAQVNADWNATTGVAQILNKPALSTVATTGTYSDLTDKPALATVATTGSYSDLSNKPDIPAAQANADWSATTGVAQILNKPALSTVATTGAYSDLTNKPALSTVATTGSYSDLSNRPTIPAAQVNTDWSATTGVAQILNKPALATVATTGSYLDLTNKPALANVATTGSYSDLSDIPASYSLPIASAVLLGGVKIGSGVSIDADGTISVAAGNGGALAIASSTELGGIKIGGGLSIDASGVLSVASTSGGTVAQVSVATANGISGVVATPTSTPVITLTLGAITPSSVTTTALTVAGLAHPTTKGLNGQVLTTNGSTAASWTTLAAVAASGSYADLTNKPTIPAAQVSADWSAISGVAQILNKPNFSTVAITGAYLDLTGRPNFAAVATSGSYLDLSNRPTIPAAQVNANWTAVSGVAQILNKPALATVATTGGYSDLTGRPTFATVATTGAYADLSGRPALSTVATTGAYADLTGRPTIPSAQVNTDWNATTGVAQILNKPALSTVATTGAYADLTGRPALSTVATTGAYADLTGRPAIPAAQVNTDWSATTGVAQILNKPALSTVATTGAYADLSGRPALSTVATTGSYLDLSNRPTVPAAQVNTDWNATTGVAQILNKPALSTVATTGAYADLSGRPVLASVANTGSYNDLLNRPTVPTAATTAPADDASAAAVGTSTTYARADHQHKLPTPAAIGAATATHQHTISDVVNLQLSLDSKQAAGTYATLVSGVVPSAQLPTYVYADIANFPAAGEIGKLYTLSTNNKVYRWTGITYAEWLPAAASTDGLPEGNTNLYFTDTRAANAAPVKTVSGKAGNVTLTKNDVGLSNVDNTTDLSKPISTAAQTALDAKAPLASPVFTGNITATTVFAAFDASARSYSREWIEFPNFTGLRSVNNSAQLYPNDGTYGSWKVNGARNGYAGIEFGDSNTSVAQRADGNLSGFYRNSYGWQFYWSAGELRCAKNQFGGGTEAVVLDSANYANYITTNTKTLAVFTPRDNQPPQISFATLDTRPAGTNSSLLVLEFDSAAFESAEFIGVINSNVSLAAGVVVRIWWVAATATSGNVSWQALLERTADKDLDVDHLSVAPQTGVVFNSGTGSAPATNGVETVTAITIANVGALAAGDRFRLRIARVANDAVNDTMAGDAQLIAVEVRVA
jgi:hypothetical protein